MATQPAPSTTVVHHGPPARDVARHKARQAVWYFFGVMETLLALRVVLLALGANRANEFFVFLLGVTQPLVAPFANLIVAPRFDGAVLELSTIFAMVIYLLLAVAVARLLDLLLAHSEA